MAAGAHPKKTVLSQNKKKHGRTKSLNRRGMAFTTSADAWQMYTDVGTSQANQTQPTIIQHKRTTSTGSSRFARMKYLPTMS